MGEYAEGEGVEALVGVILHGEFHGKRLRFKGREIDRYDTGECRHVLYECEPGRYRRDGRTRRSLPGLSRRRHR